MTFRIARRLIGGGWYGVLAGVFAALALFSSFKFVRDAALGNSEALLAALVLWAFERHLDGRRDHALYLGFAGALLRPEVWPFLGLYGLWLWFAEPYLRRRMIVLGALIPALWFLPEWWGSGEPFRAGARANNPNPGSAAFAEHPALELVSRFRKVVIAPVKAGIIIGFVYALVMWIRHRREGLTLALSIGGLAWFVLVAGMTEAGFARAWAGSARARSAASTRARSRRPWRSSSRSRSSRRSSSRRPTTPAACRAGCGTRRSSGTT
jgi:hypothetical protein